MRFAETTLQVNRFESRADMKRGVERRLTTQFATESGDQKNRPDEPL